MGLVQQPFERIVSMNGVNKAAMPFFNVLLYLISVHAM